jgi:hypothetical protein
MVEATVDVLEVDFAVWKKLVADKDITSLTNVVLKAIGQTAGTSFIGNKQKLLAQLSSGTAMGVKRHASNY